MLNTVNGRDYMTTNPVTFTPDTNIMTAIREMLDKKISGATVVDEHQNLVGVISEGDCLKAMLDGSYHGEVKGTVGDVMTTDVDSLAPDTSIIDVATKLLSDRRRRLPIVENGKFIGQFSIRSVLRAVKEFVAE